MIGSELLLDTDTITAATAIFLSIRLPKSDNGLDPLSQWMSIGRYAG